MTRAFVALAMLLLLPASLGSSCETPTPVPPEPPPATGGQPDATGGAPGTGGWINPFTGGYGTGGAPADDCEAAERHMRELDCRSSSGVPRWQTPAGTPLAVACRARAADGDPICPRCIASVASCAEVDLCRPHSPGVCP